MFIGSLFIGFILEPGERENKIPGITRVDGGNYVIVKDKTTKFTYEWGYCWHILALPRHEEIKIHRGNTVRDTDACLITGTEVGFDGSNFYVRHSTEAYNKMMETLQHWDTHYINISR